MCRSIRRAEVVELDVPCFGVSRTLSLSVTPSSLEPMLAAFQRFEQVRGASTTPQDYAASVILTYI